MDQYWIDTMEWLNARVSSEPINGEVLTFRDIRRSFVDSHSINHLKKNIIDLNDLDESFFGVPV